MGETVSGPEAIILAERQGQPAGAANREGNIFGSYLHGFFDNLNFTRRLVNNIRRAKGLNALQEEHSEIESYQQFKEKEYDRLADQVEEAVTFEKLAEIAGLKI